MLESIVHILHFVCMANIAFLFLLVLLRHHNLITGKLALGYLFSILCYLALSADKNLQLPSGARFFFFFCLSFLSVFFWLLSQALFDDDFRLRKVHYSVFGGKAMLVCFTIVQSPNVIVTDLFIRNQHFWFLLPHILFSLVLILLAMLHVYAGKNSDLVEPRRKLREIHVFITSISSLFILISYISNIAQEQYAVLRLIHIIVISILIYGFLFLAVNFKENILTEVEKTPKPAPITVDKALMTKLTHLFEQEKFYRKEGLTIRELARYLEEHEYKLRKLINQGMGFKNFNDFLNRYRIQEACEQLENRENDAVPVIRIAMELGYKSLGPFNKAFKELTGLTPSEFRKNHQSSS